MERIRPHVEQSLAATRRAGALLALCIVLLPACAFHPERRQTVEESDFIEYVPPEERRDLEERISALALEIERDFKNAELHRRLSVLYRLQGTPRSRLLSSEEIERAIMLDPGNAIYRVEKGLTLAARRFVGEAEAAFLEATRLDPRCSQAWFQLGRLARDDYLRTMCHPDRLTKAIDLFDKALRHNRRDEETLLNIGFLHSFRHMNRTGLQYADRAATYHPHSARAHLLRGMLRTKLMHFDEAAASYTSAFLLMADEERKPYENIAPLLPRDERELYLSSLPAKRADWNRRFWAENDPTPATEVNERLLEHYTRVLIADWALSNERIDLVGSQSDRGATLIRFGPPDNTYFDLGSGTSGAWVVWSYAVPGGAMRLYFNDEFLNGDYHFPIGDHYGEVSRRMLETAPPRYEYPVAYASFPIAVEMAELRGGDERTRIEFSLAIPDSLRAPAGGRWNLILTFFDSEWNRFSQDRLTLRPDSLPSIEKSGGRYRVCSGAIEILPRELGGTCVLELVHDRDRKRAARRYPLAMRAMHGRSLKLSSVRFTIPADGDCGGALDPIPLYSRRDALCLGYDVYNLKLDAGGASRYRVTYAIRKPDPDPGGSPASPRRTLAHMWESIRGGTRGEKPYAEASFEQRADAGAVSESLQIDLASLEPGVYLRVLLVEDLATGESAAESRRFTVTG
jgi:GWxTD domain-containing protein